MIKQRHLFTNALEVFVSRISELSDQVGARIYFLNNFFSIPLEH